MPRELIPSDATIRAIQPGDRRSRLSDGDGLFLQLFVQGGAHGWRLDYRFDGRRRLLSLGTYPDTSLALARRKADEARALLAQGIDPAERRKAERQERLAARAEQERVSQGLPPSGSFEAVAREWFDVKKSGWAPAYASKIIARLENDVFPWLGKLPIDEITPPQLLEMACPRRRRDRAPGARKLQPGLRLRNRVRPARSQPGQQAQGGAAAAAAEELSGDHRPGAPG